MRLFRKKDQPPGEMSRPPRGPRASQPRGTASRPGRPAKDDLDWRPYDDRVADTYVRITERVTGLPAEELVRLLEIETGALVLDVGTGTGVVARLASAAAPGVTVVGVDPSAAMLAHAQRRSVGEDRGTPRYVAGTAIDLPFRDATFTRLSANFVLSHVPSYQTALFDMLRVLRPGGRAGVSNWARSEDVDEFHRTWDGVAEEFAEHELLVDAHDRGVPWEERFADPARLKDALHEAGLRDIWVETRDFRVEMTGEEYCASREISSAGRFLHRMLGEELWEVFRRRSREVFAERFPERFNDFHQAILAVGHKP